MNVAYRPQDLELAARAVAIGTFDGVHRGHVRVLQAALATRLRPAVVTFDPHPLAVLGDGVPLLATLERRLELLAGLGFDDVLVVPFDATVAALPPEEFADRILRTIRAELIT